MAAIVARGSAARARSGYRPNGDLAVAHPHQDFRAGADDLKVGEVEIAQEGRRVDPPQRSVERERWQREGSFEALRENDLKNVAGANILLGARNHGLELGRA